MYYTVDFDEDVQNLARFDDWCLSIGDEDIDTRNGASKWASINSDPNKCAVLKFVNFTPGSTEGGLEFVERADGG